MKKMTFLSLLSTLGTSLSIALIPATTNAAGTAAYTLSPSSGSYSINSSLVVGVYENGTSVNVVTANLSYNASQLQFDSISPAAGSFGGDVSSTGGSGNISISRYVTPAGSTVSGNVEIATVDFTVLAGSGTSTVNFASSSLIESAGTNVWDGVNNSGTYNLTTPAQVTPPTTSTGSGISGSGGSGTTTAPTTTVSTSKPTTTPATKPASTTPTTATPTSPKTSQSSGKQASNKSNKSNNSKKNTKRLNAKNTADSNSYISLIYLALFVLAVGLVGFVTRRKLATNGKQGTFFRSNKPSSDTEKPAKKK